MRSAARVGWLVIVPTAACSLLTSFDGFGRPKQSSLADASPQCSASQLDCDDDPTNGCETDATRDPRHCGACGRDCLGGGCELTRCMPFQIASDQKQPSRIVVDDSHVYWANQGAEGAVMRRGFEGGAVELVAVSDKPPGGLGVDGAFIYWSEVENDGSVWKLPKADIGTGRVPTALARKLGGSVGLTLDADHVYWTTPGTIRRIPKAGGAIQLLAEDQAFPFSIVVDIGQVFWTNYQGGEVMGLLLARPDAAAPVAVGQGAPAGLAADPTRLYWVNNQPDADGGAPAVMTIAKVNTSSPTALVKDQAGPVDVAVSGSDAFWTNSVGGTVPQS